MILGAAVTYAQTTNSIGTATYSSSSPLAIPSGTVILSTGTINLTANSTATYTAVTGPGLLQLAATSNGVNSPDIYFNNNDTDNSTSNWGTRIGAPVSLGSTQRVIFGKTNHSSVDKYGVTTTDCEFTGTISGTAGITYIAQDGYTGSNPMECPLALDAANTFSGPLIIQRGSIYLGAAGAFPAGDVLQFNPASGSNAKFFLYGNNATVADLTSAGTGAALIANGNRNPSPIGPATLTITENNSTTYAGTLVDTNVEYANTGGSASTILNVVKNGPATLTLTGTVKFSGTLAVSAGKLYVNTASSGGGNVTVGNGAVLGGNNTISAAVSVANGGGLEGGDGTGTGTLTVKGLALGASGSDALTLNFAGNAAGVTSALAVTGASALTNNGVTTINITGSLPLTNPTNYTLISYAGTVKGSGTFVLGSIPRFQTTAYLTNNTAAAAIQLVVPLVVSPNLAWVGYPTNRWDLSGSNVWRQTGSLTPAYYTNGTTTIFDDTATNFSVNLAALVQPTSVIFSNITHAYTVIGTGGITNTAGLTKLGAGSVTLATTNAYTGNTTVAAGILALGASTAIPAGPTAGNVTVNGTLDLGGFSPALINLSGTGVVDNVSAGGNPVVTVSNTANSSFTGAIQNSSGSVTLTKTGSGTLTLDNGNTYSGGTVIAAGAVSISGANGLGTGAVSVTANLAGGTASFLTVATNTAVTLSNDIALPNASGTYVLTKNASGQLTLAGKLSGGTGAILRTTTDTTGDATTTFEFAATNASFAGGLQTFRGSVQIDNPLALGTGTIYGDGNNGTAGDLLFNASMTFQNPLVIQSATSISSGANTVTMGGNVSGNGNLTKYGSGTLNFSGALAYNGTLAINAGTASIGSLILAGDTTSGGGLGAADTNYISIAAGATLRSYGTLSLYESSSLEPYVGVTGAGTLVLAGTNSPASPDIYFAANDTIDNSTANWGCRIATAVDIGNAQRYIWGRTDHTSVDVYGVSQADCQFAGPISGAGGLTFIAQNNSSGSDGELMETPFCLNAANTFTGPMQIQRGSVYLGANSAFPAGDVLQFNVAAGNSGKFFLYGHDTTVANLSSTGAGTAIIANGNRNPSPVGPATLTVLETNSMTYAGAILDTNAEYVNTTTGAATTLNLVKGGPGDLTLTGTSGFSGTMTVNAGRLFLNTASTGGGKVAVNAGATLAGNGSLAASVAVNTTATIEAGGGSGSGLGTLSMSTLGLGANPALDTVTLNIEAVPSGLNSLSITQPNGLTNNATVTVNVSGVMPANAPATYTLIAYTGAMRGAGKFVLGTVPDQAVAYVTNNTSASAIQLVVSSVVIPSITWVGASGTNWDLLGGNVWRTTGTATPAAYAELDQVVFDDSASSFLVNLAAPVNPNGVTVSNTANYTIAGSGAISGYSSLFKQGNGALLLATTNSYSGATVISGGTLTLGAPSAVPGGPGAGNFSLNGTLDLNGFSPTLNNLSGAGTVDDLTAGGSPTLTLSNSTASTFDGLIQNSSGSVTLSKSGAGTLTLTGNNSFSGGTTIGSGTLQLGSGGTSGTLGAGGVADAGTLAFNRSDTNTFPNDIAGPGGVQQNGPGTTILQGNLIYTGPTVVNAGVLAMPKDHTFDAANGTTLNIAAGAIARISGTVVNLNVNANGVVTDVSGAGTMQFASTLNSIESFSDLNIGINQNGTSDFGCRIDCNVDLGSVHRTIYGWTGGNDVARNGLAGCDCQFAGSIVGTAILTFEGQNNLTTGVNPMEVPFALNASNSFTGQLEIRRGSVYLGNANALTAGNPLLLDPALGVSSRLFLYGFNASVSDLQSTAYGAALIANGNGATSTNVGPATLTITQNNPATFGGSILDWYTEFATPAAGSFIPTLSLVKNGAAALTLTGTNAYSGVTVINAGKLYFDNSYTGGGAVTVNNGGTLAGNGYVGGAVTVKNGGAIETGGGNFNGDLRVKSLTLGNTTGDHAALNLAATAQLNVTNNNGLVLNGGANSATINIGGNFGGLGAYPLLTYAGNLGGSGFAAFKLGTLPVGIIGYLSNDTANASVDFVVTTVTIPRWTGAFSQSWSTATLPSPKNWVLDSDGVTPLDYVDGEAVRFDDTASATTVNIDAANVSPFSITVSNATKAFAVNGPFGITGAGSLVKQGAGKLNLNSSNSYSGATLISAGTLVLGSAAAISPNSSSVTVNGSLDVAGLSPTLNNLSGTGFIDNKSAGGTAVLTIVNTASNTFSGAIQNSTGIVSANVSGGGVLVLKGANTLSGLISVSNATLSVAGQVGTGGITLASSAVLSGSGVVTGPVTLADGSTLILTANSPLTVGPLTLNGKVSVNIAGNVSLSSPGTYALLNHGAETGSGSFGVIQLAGLSPILAAKLVDTNNQLQLVVAPGALTGTIADVKHVVVFMQENRSFDHYFGTLHGVHGFSDRNILMFTNGNSDLYQPSGGSYELPFHTSTTCLNDLDHSWGPTHNAIDDDRNDGWIANKGAETMCYYNRGDLPYYYALADAYTVCDDYHCSVRASTDPNRVSLMTGMVDPTGMGAATINGTTYPGGPLIDNTEPAVGWGPGWVTYPELLQKAGVSWRVYQQTDNYDDNALAWFAVYKQATAGNPLHDNGNVFSANVVTQFQNDVTSNALPAVSWIIGPTAQTEHPPYSTQSGEALTKQFLDALASNPTVYSNTVFILCFDENDGFYDHGLPITPPTGTANEYVNGLSIGLGIRVPCVIVSPWTRGGHVCSQVFDHTSILRFLETWTGVREPNISAWRRSVCGDLTTAFDFTHPVYDYPTLPATTPVNCGSGSTPAVPSPQVVPVQESGTLAPRPLPYEPNAWPSINAANSQIRVVMTNSGAASFHFLVVPNAYRPDNPTPFDVATSNSATLTYSTTSTSGKYDLSCYGPDGFERRFVGNVNSNGVIEAVSYLNPAIGGIEIGLANATPAPVNFTVVDGYALTTNLVTVPAHSTNVVLSASATNYFNYDLTVTANADSSFLRRFLGRVQTNGVASTMVSSLNPSPYGSNVTFTASFTGYGTPTGTVQFQTNGINFGAPLALVGGTASLSTLLPRGSTIVSAIYSGDTYNLPATNSLTETVTNRPPSAAALFIARTPGVSTLIRISDLLTNVTDPDGDVVTLAGIGADGFNLASTNGATLFNNGTFILYTNSVTPNVNDRFQYTVTDGFGGTNAGMVYLILANNVVGQTSPQLSLTATNLAATFFGIPSFRYVVDRSTNLSVGIGWVPISTNNAPTNGIFQVPDNFQDLGFPVPPLPSSVFYRLRYNP
jgi:phospholipase C